VRSEPDATPCAQAAQLNVSLRLNNDVDQPPVATHQIDQIFSHQNSAAIQMSAAQNGGYFAPCPVPSATVRDVKRGTACRLEPLRCASWRQGERDRGALWMGMAATEFHC
jgi:hypothetical protein